MLTSTIKTERMLLRSMTEEDAYAVFMMWGFEEGKYLHDPYYKSAEELQALFNDIADWTDYPFVAIDKETNEIMGTCSVGPASSPEEWGFGYVVRKDYWGKGYATEMAKAMIDFAYSLGIRSFSATHAIENEASGKVMRKCGMKLDQVSSFKKAGTDIVYPSHIYKLHMN